MSKKLEESSLLFIGAMIMLYGRASDFLAFESTKLFEVETEFPVMTYNNLKIDMSGSVTRIEGYFQPPFDRTIEYDFKRQMNSYTKASEKGG